MTLLSITASFGALVWIFQDGNLSNVLDFEPLGYTIAGNPIIMFSVIFGLSMDYEVLLLSRIQEAYRRTGDNTAVGRRGPGEDRRRHHRRGADHGHRSSPPSRLADIDHDQEHRRRHGDRGRHRRDDRPDPARAGDDAAAGQAGTGGRRGRSGGSPTGSASATSRTKPRRWRRGGRDGVARRLCGPARDTIGPVDSRAMATRIPPPDEQPLRRQLLRVALGAATSSAGRACRGSASSSSCSAACSSSSRPLPAVPRPRQHRDPGRGHRLARRLGVPARHDRALRRRVPDGARRARTYEAATGTNLGPGWGTLCFGLAFLFIAAVRAVARRRLGLAADVGLGPRPARRAPRSSSPTSPGSRFPLIVVAIGVLLLVGSRNRR